MSKPSSTDPNQVRTSSENEDPIYEERSEIKFTDGQATSHTMKVTDLHDPFNIIERINKSDTIHSHSITSEDFAQRTSLINMTSKERSPLEHIQPQLDEKDDEDSLSYIIVPVQDLSVDEYRFLQDQPVISNSSTNEVLVDDNVHINHIGTLNITELTSNVEDSINYASDISSVQNIITLSHPEGNIHVNSVVSEDPQRSQNFTGLINKVKDEIKTYSNDAVIAWEELKERVSSDNEVSHVLNDFLDKIAISQSVNRSECVEPYIVKYESRLKFLKDVMQSCESQMKREQWQELQNRTKEVLKSINEIIQETNLAKENCEKDAGVNYESKESIEIDGIRKLKSLDIEKEKQALSDLKKSALNTDEDDYRDCIIRNTGHEIIVDTLNDIMKIKNNCVG